MMKNDVSAFVVSEYDVDKCKATTPIILHGRINALRETSCIANAGRATFYETQGLREKNLHD